MAVEKLVINGLSLDDLDTYWIQNLAPLRSSATRRGDVEPMPYVAGGIAFTHRKTVSEITLPLHIHGATWTALDVNETTVRTTVVGGDAVLPVPAVWHRASGAQWTADVIVLGLFDPEFLGYGPGPVMQFNLVLRLPSGEFSAP